MSKSSDTATTTSDTTSGGGTTGGGSGTQGGPHPKRTLEIILLFTILILVAYDTYIISQNHQALQSQQLSR
jgi:hypothetical protein